MALHRETRGDGPRVVLAHGFTQNARCWGPFGDELAAGHEVVAAVEKAIAELPAEYQQAVQLRLLQGKSLEETAELMGRSPRAVQGLVDRAKKKLRAVLGRLSMYE